MKSTGLTILVAVIGLLGAAGLAFGIVEIQRLNGELASLRSDVKRANDRAGDAEVAARGSNSADDDTGGDERDAEIARLTNTLADLENKVRANDERIDDVALNNGDASDATGAMSSSEQAAAITAMREELDSLHAELDTMRQRDAALAEGMRKMSESMGAMKEGEMQFEQMAEIVGLTPAQEDMLAEQILTHKQQVLDLVTRPDENGAMLADGIIDVFFNPEVDEGERGAAFMKLLASPVPGEDRTFGELIGELEGNLQTQFMEGLSDEQRQAYAQLRVHPKDLKLPNDPVEAWIFQRARDLGYTVPGQGENE